MFVQVMGAGIALHKIMAAGDAVFPPIQIAQLLDGRNAYVSCFKIGDSDGNVNDGFGGDAGNGGAADVLNVEDGGASGRCPLS